MITSEQIQKRLAEAIQQSDISQTEIAKKLKINQSNISRYITGDKMPALDTLANLCRLLDVDTNYILCQDN
jgi:transcriptional regulator with XRE-family HTH domain